MSKSFVKGLVRSLVACFSWQTVKATGDYGPPPRWLENGGLAIDQSPEFFWDDMLRYRAKEIKPVETLGERSPDFDQQRDAADQKEFHEAIEKGILKPADPAAAESANAQEQDEMDSEFADYHHGATAFRDGKLDEAEAGWKKLLARPKEQRHYRSVWAAFMLGKMGMKTGAADTVKWFQQCRALAKEGFADALGLAADSYGWEAKTELEAGHREEAAKLYLTQLALGDETALVSLKALIPDRGVLWGTLSFGPDGKLLASDDNAPNEPDKVDPAVQPMLLENAKMPTLRWLQTAHVLATETTKDWAYSGSFDNQTTNSEKPKSRSERWLDAVKAAKVKAVEDADRLGWVAYTAGDYAAAQEWLGHCKEVSGLSRWLDAKLLRRNGSLDKAIKAMSESVALLEKEVAAHPMTKEEAASWRGNTSYLTLNTAHGDLAVLHLAHDDFIEALDHFAQTTLGSDMAYVAERLLSADELKSYVDKHVPAATKKEEADNDESERLYGYGDGPKSRRFLRDVLARRLVREDRYDEARKYFGEAKLPVFEDYVGALKKGENAKLPKKERARALFHAACVLTSNGGEFMATFGEPDNLSRYETVTTLEREAGKLMERGPNNKFVDAENRKPLKFHVPVTKEEKKRLEAHKIIPFRTDHYRYVALGLVWRSAALLPDHSEELADILNTAGNWMKGDYRGDDEAADKFFQAIEHRASKTDIGKAAGAKHWFVDEKGPWSSEEVTSQQ